MDVHLIDGTYELFRSYYSPRGGHRNAAGREVGAARGVLRSMIGLLEDGATHVGIATDHVIESFRNDLWPGYKDGSGIEAELRQQFQLLEDVLEAAGFTVWPMVEFEADDALAAAAAIAHDDPDVERVFVCTPDKDMAQCVVDPKVVVFDRRANEIRDAAAVIEKYGVAPESIPDWLALVGDSADGFPGLPGWGAKSAATVLRRWERLDAIPEDPTEWDVDVRGAQKLAATLRAERANALLFRVLATLDTAAPVGVPADWQWTGPRPESTSVLAELDAPDVVGRLSRLAQTRAAGT
jgi:5'-3' exonuclease